MDRKLEQELIEARDYEALDAYTLRHLLGVPTAAATDSQHPVLLAGGQQ